MYFPCGWPKVIDLPDLGGYSINKVNSNRDRVLFTILTDDSIAIWYCKVFF